MDKFINAYKDVVLGNYANFSGRLGVGGFWRYVAVNLAIAIVLGVILSRITGFFLIIYWLYALAVLVPGLAATVRRLHDTGKAWTYILVGLVPIVGAILLIVWTVAKGDPATNQFGAPPAT